MSTPDAYRFAQQLAQQAGDILLKYFGTELTRTIKTSESDFATQADLEAERFIKDAIRAQFPNDAMLGEETGFEGNKDAEYTWIIDPLDGTYNFAQGNDHFGSMIARAHGPVIECAAIGFPRLQLNMHASVGQGASIGNTHVLRTEQPTIQEADFCVSDTPYPGDSLAGVKAQRRVHAYLESLGRDTESFMSSAANALMMLQGKKHAFILNNNSPWDTAPIDVILREAGFLVTDWEGRAFDWKKGLQPLLAALPSLHPQLMQLLREEPKTRA